MRSLGFISTIPFNPSERGIISPQFLIGRMRLGSEKWVDLLKTHGGHRIELKLQPTQTNRWVLRAASPTPTPPPTSPPPSWKPSSAIFQTQRSRRWIFSPTSSPPSLLYPRSLGTTLLSTKPGLTSDRDGGPSEENDRFQVT